MKMTNVKKFSTFDKSWLVKFRANDGVEVVSLALGKSLNKLLSNGINIAAMMNNPRTRQALKKAA